MVRFRLSTRERWILQKLGEAAFPETAIMPPFDVHAVEERIERFFSGSTALGVLPLFFRSLLQLVEQGARLPYRRPMSELPPHKRLEYLNRYWVNTTAPKRMMFHLFSIVLRVAYLNDPMIFHALGLEYRKPAVSPEPPPRWHGQILSGRQITNNQELAAEVVVVGTGAGGATVAHELAQRGNAVVMVEAGNYFDRSQFSGRPFEMQQLMYQQAGLTTTMGNVMIPVPLGRTVGGTTTINSGTCLRTPRRTLRRWREELALTDYTPLEMEPYFQRVEKIFDVSPADMKYVGKNGEIIARGADKLGYRHGPLPRNAPDCDGQSVCCYGCPSGAKRSTDISFVPKALQSNAQLLCRVRCEEILLRNSRVTGIRAVSLDTGKQVTIKAPVVVLAGGALNTPLMLMKQGLCNASGQLGLNLSLHPCTAVLAMMEEVVSPDKTIPQGYMVDEFEEDGILLEGATFPLESISLMLSCLGDKAQQIVQSYKRLASFGVMVCDTSRGKVLPGPARNPLTVYFLNQQDQARLRRGIEILVRIYLAAGASEVYVNVHRWKPMRCVADLADNLSLKTRAADMPISAYHPLGTCHMSGHRGRSVCDPNGETYEIDNLFIADGSLIPPSLGANPQITIAAVAARIGSYINDRLSRLP